MQLFFTAHIDGDKAFLDAEESRHCKVLRKNEGDQIQVLDGQGLLLRCSISKIKKDQVELDIISSEHFPRQRKYYFHLLIAPTKQNERMEWMLEKAIEAGLDEISFMETAHSEKTRVNMGRLEKIAVSAIKQSQQYYLPKINPVVTIAEVPIDSHTLLAHCGEGEKISLMQAVYPISEGLRVAVMIGPEGDFSEQEVNMLMQKGVKAIHLGNNRLRTETAGLYCAVMLNGLS
jgi:16S rRNA (uracil1498-N3)-methyltransferase